MKVITHRTHTLISEAVLLLALILYQPDTGNAQKTSKNKGEEPMQLQLILSPGRQEGNNIIFSTDESQTAVKTKRKNIPSENVQEIQEPQTPVVVPFPDIIDFPETTDETIDATTAEPTPETHLQKPLYIDFEPHFSFLAGYRWDELSWTISPTSGSPNILSELTWEDLETYEIKADARWSNASRLYFHGAFGFGWTQDGTVIDSDYLSDNRQHEYSRSYSNPKRGTVGDISAGAGYRFDLPLTSNGGRLQFIPLLGYGLNFQNLRARNGTQILSEYGNSMPLGPFDELDSTYEASWKGPWIGFDLILGFSDKHNLSGSFGFHWSSYEAEANWNLRDDFDHPISFEHSADGTGITASLSYSYDVSESWYWTMGFDYKNFNAESGKDTTYFYDDSYSVITFNGADWESYSLLLGIGFKL